MIDPRALIRCSKCGKHISGLSLEASTKFGYSTVEEKDRARDYMRTCDGGGEHDFPGLRESA